jgi:hypothetical protein
MGAIGLVAGLQPIRLAFLPRSAGGHSISTQRAGGLRCCRRRGTACGKAQGLQKAASLRDLFFITTHNQASQQKISDGQFLRRQFNLNGHAAKRAHGAVKARGFRHFQISKKATRPGAEMAGEKRLGRCGTTLKYARQQPRKAFAFGCDVILGLGNAIGAFNAKPREIPAQISERAFMQKARDVIRSEGQQFAAPKANEQIVEFALNALRIGGGGGLSQGAVAFAKRRGITRQGGEGGQQMGIRGSHEQTAKEREKPRSFGRHGIRCHIFLHHGAHSGRRFL